MQKRDFFSSRFRVVVYQCRSLRGLATLYPWSEAENNEVNNASLCSQTYLIQDPCLGNVSPMVTKFSLFIYHRRQSNTGQPGFDTCSLILSSHMFWTVFMLTIKTINHNDPSVQSPTSEETKI